MLERGRRREHLEAAEPARPDHRRPQEHGLVGVAVGVVGSTEHERHTALAGRAEHVLRQRIGQHRRLEHLGLGQGLAPPGHRVLRAVAERLLGHLGQRRLRDAVLVHVPVDLHPEELCGQGQAGGAVPVAEPAALGVHAERAALVLVEPDRDAEIEDARLDRVERTEERRASGGTAVGDVDELEPGEPELRHHRVGRAGGVRAPEGELDVVPAHAGVGTGAPDRGDALLHARDAVVATELVHPDPDDRDLVTHVCSVSCSCR